MIKVDQTLFGLGEGNCLTACVSTITGIPLHSIPHFCKLYTDDTWYGEFTRWLRPLGLAPWSCTIVDNDIGFADALLPDIPWIACGRNQRDVMHCCVYVGGAIYHDPNPCRDGLKTIVDGTFFLSKRIHVTAFP